MFERLAKIRRFALWPIVPQREAVRLQALHCNDNQLGLRRPEGRRRARQTLVCRWSLSRDGRPECRWELDAAGKRSSTSPAAVARLAAPSKVPASDPLPDLGLAAS